MVIITSYPTRANGIIVLVNSQTGFVPPIFISRSEVENFARKIFKLGALFSIANQKARNAIVGAENLLNMNSCISDESYEEKSDFIVAAVLIVDTVNKETNDEN